VLTTSLPPDHKYFLLQGHVVEGLGDLFWAIFVGAGWCWYYFVVSVYLILSLPFFCLFPLLLIVEAVMPLVAL
jgi:hypothetical protein